MAENGSERRPQPLELCGLWRKEDRNGRPYLAGTLGGVRVLIFEADRRGNERAPTHRLLVAPREERGERVAAPGRPKEGMPERGPAPDDPAASLFD